MAEEQRASRIAGQVALAALGALLAWHLYGFAVTGIRAVGYPYELDYGEGIVWFQARQLLAGEAFGPIDRFPAIVFHYTPLFHALSGLLERLGLDGLAAGRALSLLSTAAMALLVGAIVRHVALGDGADRRAATIAATVAGLTLLVAFPVKVWAPLMRVDMLAFALALGGMWCGLGALRRPGFVHLAALLFVLALFTKQTMIAAPAATFLVLLLHRPRTAVAGIATCLVLGSAALTALAVATDGGFLRHVFLYNVNRIALDRLEWIGSIALGHGLLIAAAVIGVAAKAPAIRQFLANRRAATVEDAGAAMLFAYLLLTTASNALVLKSGSGVNYFIEWIAVLAIFAGFAVHRGLGRTGGPASPIRHVAVIALAAQAALLPAMPYSANMFEKRRPGLDRLVEQVRSAPGPVISDDMVLLLRAGRPVLWEPAIFAELAATGAWDERPFVTMIEQQRFAMFVTVQQPGGALFDQRYNPAVAKALTRAYPRREKVAGLTVHRPR